MSAGPHLRYGGVLVAVAAILVLIADWTGLAMVLRTGGVTPATSAPPPLSTAGRPVPGESYVWKPVAIGGGGSVTGFASDTRGDTRIVRTDVYGAYIWREEAGRWEQLVTARSMPPEDRWQGSMAQGVYEIAVAPGNPRRLYMALRGRIYRSDDRGRNWTRPAEGPEFRFSPNGGHRFRGAFLAVSPDDPDLLFLGTERQGLWRSTDGARSWQAVAAAPPSAAQGDEAPAPMLVWFAPPAPEQPQRAAPLLLFSPGHGLYRSMDKGRSFAPVGTDQSATPRDLARGAFAPGGDFFAVSSTERSVYRLHQGRWRNLVAEGRVAAHGFVGVAIDPRSGRIIVVDDGGTAFASADQGESWTRLSHRARVGEGEPPWLRVTDISYFATGALFPDPVVPDRLWAMTGAGPYYADCPEGCTDLVWTSAVRGIEELVASDVIQPAGRAPLFAALDFGIHLKEDLDAFSTGYGPAERVLIAAQQIAWTPADPDFIVTNASDTRTFCCAGDGNAVMAGYSSDGGRNWHKFPTLPQPPGTRADDPWRMAFGTIAVAADTPDNIVWVPGYDRAPFYTLNRGLTWHRVIFPGEVPPHSGSYPNIWVQRKTLAADRVRPGTFYFYHGGNAFNPGLAGLWRTGDGGRNWEQVHKGRLSPRDGFGAKLRAVPGRAGHLFFTSAQPGEGEQLLRSTDGGEHWSRIDTVSQVDDIAFGKAAPGVDYPAIYISGRVEGRYGIWRSTDALGSWRRIADFPLDRLDQVVVMEADKDIFGRVYLGLMGSGWVYGEPGSCAAAKRGKAERICGAVN